MQYIFLNQENYQQFEESVAKETNKTLILVLDKSGSMSTDFHNLKTEAFKIGKD